MKPLRPAATGGIRSCLQAALAGMLLVGAALSAQSGAVSSTIYVGRHFEIRDHGQPTKYVFNGATRVAAVIGSLSSNRRVQRLRLWPGWNLLSLAVNAEDVPGQFERSQAGVGQAIYEWDALTRSYASVAPGQSCAAGTVLWVEAWTNATVSVFGSYSDPAAQQVQSAGTYVPAAGLEAWPVVLPNSASTWGFDSTTREWSDHLPGDLASVSGPSPVLAPGQALFIRVEAPANLVPPEPALRIRYYHEDHLGSSSLVSDAAGQVVEESAFYPFGVPRDQFEPRQLHEPYQFTQKERDDESGLHYFEARFLAAGLSRFTAVDMKYANPESFTGDLSSFLANPQMGNLYAYVFNNPFRFTDPTGLGWRDVVWIPFVDPISELDVKRTFANAGAGIGVVAGAVSCPSTGFGCGLAAVSTDYIQADLRGTRPVGAQAISVVTGSDKAGDLGYALLDLALSFGTAEANMAKLISKPAAPATALGVAGRATMPPPAPAPPTTAVSESGSVASSRPAVPAAGRGGVIGVAQTVPYSEVLEEPGYFEQLKQKMDARVQMIGQHRAEMDAMINSGQSAGPIILQIENALDTMFPGANAK